jgi:hypothetical protein
MNVSKGSLVVCVQGYEHIMSHCEQIDVEGGSARQGPALTSEQRLAVYHELLLHVKNGRPMKGSFKMVATRFGVHWKTISRIWKHAQESIAAGTLVPYLKMRHTGAKMKVTDVNAIVTSVPLRRRTTLRALSAATGIPTMTLWRRKKDGAIRAHSNAIKPLLTDQNKNDRLRFCLSMLQPSTMTFLPMHDVVYVDEKWFYLMTTMKHFYLADGENAPLQSCKSKRFIQTVMFLVAVGRL